MRRVRSIAAALLLMALVLGLGGCQKEAPAPPDSFSTELAYPGTYWTMSPDQVKDALSLPASGLPEDEQPADPIQGFQPTIDSARRTGKASAPAAPSPSFSTRMPPTRAPTACAKCISFSMAARTSRP